MGLKGAWGPGRAMEGNGRIRENCEPEPGGRSHPMWLECRVCDRGARKDRQESRGHKSPQRVAGEKGCHGFLD